MTKQNQDFVMWAGDNKLIDVTVVDGDGVAVDITGATIKWVLAKTAGDSALVTKTTGDGITITDAAAGKFRVTLVPADTESLAGVYYHEAEVTDASSQVSTVLIGKVIVYKSAA